MLLTKVVLRDYGLYAGKTEFDLNCSQDKPIILIGGNNGSGKTTLFESIMLCLYGISAFDKKVSKKKYDQYLIKKIHRYSGSHLIVSDSASITIEFQFSHGGKMVEYMVERSWENVKGAANEQLIIKKKDPGAKEFEILDKIEESYWQSFIGNLIPRGIVNLFFFDGERIVRMADEENTDIAIRTSFNSLLGIDIVDQLRNDLQANLMRNLSGDEKQLEQEYTKYTKEREELKQKNEDIQTRQEELELEKIDARKEIDDMELKISQQGGEFARNRGELQEKKITCEAEMESLSNEIRNLCSAELFLTIIPKELVAVENGIKDDEALAGKKVEVGLINTQAKKIQEIINAEKLWMGVDVKEQTKKKLTTNLTEMVKPIFTNSKSDKKEMFGFSISQSTKVLDAIKQSRDMVGGLEVKTQKLDTIINELKKIDTALVNAPNDDVMKPMLAVLGEKHSAFTLIQAEIEKKAQETSSNDGLVRHIDVKVRNIIAERYENKKSHRKTELTEKVQKVLDKYADKLRDKKMRLLEEYLLDSLKILLHKKSFINKVVIDPESFKIKLYGKEDKLILKEMLSKGEQQMFATAVLWALAKTSGRPLPFMIDTPLARLDTAHRDNLILKFFPTASHQVLILSTDSEIDATSYTKLLPFISRTYKMEYDPESGKTIQHEDYFWNKKGEKVIEVQ